LKLTFKADTAPVTTQLNAMLKRLNASQIAAIGAYVQVEGVPFADSIPARFKMGGPGWHTPVLRPTGERMIDTGRLSESIAYEVQPGGLARIGTNVPYGAQLNGDYGDSFTIEARNREWLTVPNPAVLTPSEVRSAQATDFPKAFKLVYGPEGPGIYRQRGPSGRRFIEKLFSLKKSVTIRARKFLKVSEAGMEIALQAAQHFVHTGETMYGIPIKQRHGNPDVGPRKGGRP
jgi:phage gpG-like protein